MKPDYNRSILSITSSVLKYYDVKSNYKSLKELDNYLNKEYKNVVYFIIDCMGINIMDKYLTDKDILKNKKVADVTTIYPSTTVAATTAFHSGLSPYENGWIGWMPYIKECNRAVELFTGNDFYTKESVIDINNLNLKYETIYEKITKKNKDVNYTQFFPAFAENGSNTFEELCEKIVKEAQNDSKNIISAYWDELDKKIHKYGIDSNEVKEELININKNIEKLSKLLKDSVIIISADHGAVNVNEVYLNEIKELDECLKLPPTIESRFVSFFIKEGMNEKFIKEFNKNFNEGYKLYTKEEFLKEELLGRGKKHERIDSYLGDIIFISEKNLSIRYATNGIKDDLIKSDHSGISKDEMLVPVIAIKCE